MVLLAVALILLVLVALLMLRSAAGTGPRWLADYQREVLGDDQYLAWASWGRTALRSLGRILLAIAAFLLLVIVVTIVVTLVDVVL